MSRSAVLSHFTRQDSNANLTRVSSATCSSSNTPQPLLLFGISVCSIVVVLRSFANARRTSNSNEILKFSPLLAAILLISGCAFSGSASFALYSGQQQNWPTQVGSFISTKYAVPVYLYSWPDRPYTVLGMREATTARIAVTYAARGAKEIGADAIIVRGTGQQYAGSISNRSAFTAGNFYNRGFSATTVGTGLSVPLLFERAEIFAIKWK